VTLPEVNDDLAKMVGDLETVQDLRDHLAEQLRQRLEAQAWNQEFEAAIQALEGVSEFEYPEVVVERRLEARIAERRAQIQAMGLDWNRFLELSQTSEEALREELRPQVERDVRSQLLLLEYAKQENLEADAALVERYVSSRMARNMRYYGDTPEQSWRRLQETGEVNLAVQDALIQKAAEHLVERLTGRLAEQEEAEEETGAEPQPSQEQDEEADAEAAPQEEVPSAAEVEAPTSEEGEAEA